MKKYRNVSKGPLPIDLGSKVISVPGKGFFTVDESDANSPGLLRRLRRKQVTFIEDVGVRVEALQVPTVPKDEIVTKPSEKPKSLEKTDIKPFMTSIDEKSDDEKDGDTLTSTSKMVESKDDGAVSDDKEEAKNERNKSAKPAKKSRRARKKTKGISGSE